MAEYWKGKREYSKVDICQGTLLSFQLSTLNARMWEMYTRQGTITQKEQGEKIVLTITQGQGQGQVSNQQMTIIINGTLGNIHRSFLLIFILLIYFLHQYCGKISPKGLCSCWTKHKFKLLPSNLTLFLKKKKSMRLFTEKLSHTQCGEIHNFCYPKKSYSIKKLEYMRRKCTQWKQTHKWHWWLLLSYVCSRV